MYIQTGCNQVHRKNNVNKEKIRHANGEFIYSGTLIYTLPLTTSQQSLELLCSETSSKVKSLPSLPIDVGRKRTPMKKIPTPSSSWWICRMEKMRILKWKKKEANGKLKKGLVEWGQTEGECDRTMGWWPIVNLVTYQVYYF